MADPTERELQRAGSLAARPAWYRGDNLHWGLTQELAWIRTQERPDLLQRYVVGLRRRVVGFDGTGPLSAEDRTRLREAVEQRLEALQS